MIQLTGPYDYLNTLCYDEIVLYQYHSPWLGSANNNISSTDNNSTETDNLMQGILGEENQIASTAVKIGVISTEHIDWNMMKSIGQSSGDDPIIVRCSPEYRAGLVYYLSGDIAGALSICFDCFGVQWDGIDGYANQQFYTTMKSVFLRHGYVDQPRPSDDFYSRNNE